MNGFKNLHIITFFLISILIFAFLPGRLSAQEPLKTGTTGASFLELGIGARAVAMGEAYVAIAEGANGAYWNPAGPGMLSDVEASFMQMNYVVDIDLQNVALVIPIPGIITFGGMITNLAVPDDKIRTLEDPEGERGESFEVRSTALSLLLARKFTDRFSVGLGVKYIHERLHVETANAVAFDFGVLIKTHFLNDMTLGMSISNFGSGLQFAGEDLFRQHADRSDISGTNQNLPVNYETETWPLPITFRIGVAMNLLNRQNQKLRLALDALHPNNIDESLNVGGEFTQMVGKLGEVALRGGYSTLFQEESQQGLTLGGGLNIFVQSNLSVLIDYAYTNYEYFGDIHRYSISFKL